MSKDLLFPLFDNSENTFYNASSINNFRALKSVDSSTLNSIDGHFGIVLEDNNKVKLARTIGVILRYFIAKIDNEFCVVVSDRIDKIYEFCKEHGIADEFDPYYTRMVPAHYLVEIDLASECKITYRRFLSDPKEKLPANVETIGKIYIQAVYDEVKKWLTHIVPKDEMVALMFSGGIDSTAILLLLVHAFKELGRGLNNLRAFTLSVDGGGTDLEHAREIVEKFKLQHLWEVISLSSDKLSVEDAICTIEDYHPLDVQCATACLRTAEGIRARYPELLYLTDGDGNDENLKSYPVEDSNLTLEDVISVPLLYQEGWGIDHVKYNLTFSNGLSRSYIRSYAVDRHYGFKGISHFVAKPVIQIASAIPFRELVQGSKERLYQLKGDITKAGVKSITGFEMPIFPKARFQRSSMSEDVYKMKLTFTKAECKTIFNRIYGLREVSKEAS